MEQQVEPQPEQAIVITAEQLAPVRPIDTRIELEKGISYFPKVALALILVCVATFIWQLATSAFADERAIMAAGALQRDAVIQNGEYWRLLSSMFLHGGFDHLLGNMMVLYVLGMASEHGYGLARTAAVYLATGIAGGLLTLVLDDRPTVGASGAIFGLMGFVIVFVFWNRKRIMVRENRIGVVLAVWAVYQLVLGFLTPLVANWAHIGGLASGCLAALVIAPTLPGLTNLQD